MITLFGWPARWLALALLLAGFVASFPVSASDSGPYYIQIEQVDAGAFPLVTLYVAVTDRSSDEIVSGLKQEQFTVYEDGKQVEIVKFSAGNLGAISTVLTIDRSGSMEVEGKMAGAQQAATAFVGMMRPQDQVALIVFDDTVILWQDFSVDQALLRQRINSITIGGCTAWYDGVWQTVDLMAGVAGRRNAILLSDGIDCREAGLIQRLLGARGSEHTLDESIQHAVAADVAIHTIGLGARATSEVSDEGFDEMKLKRMAQETGGTYHHSPTARQLRTLYESFAESTQREYVITIKSGRASYDGTRRNLKVTVGGSAGSGGYVEKHLLNVQSSPWAALAFMAPLVLALVIPLVWSKSHPPRTSPPAQSPAPAWSSDQYVHQPPGPSAYPEVRPPVYPPQPPAVAPPPSASPAFGPVQPAVTSTTCPYCGQPVRAGARFCVQCGMAQPMGSSGQPSANPGASPAVMCSHCGQPLRPNVRFCSVCGQRNSR